MRSACRTALGLALLAVAFVVPGAAQAGDEGILVRARSSSYVEITVPATVEVVEDEIRVSTRGRYAGFYLLPLFQTHESVGALWSPRLGADGTAGRLIPLADGWEVTAGRYRLYVLTEAPADIFIPLPGTAFRAYRTTHRARVSVQQSGFALDSADQAGGQRIPAATASQRALVTAVSYATSTSLTGIDLTSACLAPARQSCGTTALPTMRAPASAARVVDSGLRVPGRYDGVFSVERAAGSHGDTKVATLLLVVNA